VTPTAPTPPARPRPSAGYVFSLVVLVVLGVPLVWMLADYLLAPNRRDPRVLVPMTPLFPPVTYCALAVLKRWFPRQLGPPAWHAVFVLVALATLLAPSLVVESLARVVERAGVARQLAPVVEALHAEQARLGRPTTELQPLLRQKLPRVPERWGRIALHMTYGYGADGFRLSAMIVPMDRDDSAWQVYQSRDRSWTRVEANSGQDAEPQLPPLQDQRFCACWQRGDQPWECSVPCGTFVPPAAAAVEPSPEPSPSPSPSPEPSPSVSPSPRRRRP
jgi:hypothetical protein